MTLPVLNVILWNVKSCCYGLTSLRIGTTIIFGLTLIFSTLQLFGWYPLSTDERKAASILGYYALQYAVLGIIISVCGFIGLYGNSNRKSSFLLPYIIVTAVETVLLWIAMVPTVPILLSEKQSYDEKASKIIGYISEQTIDDTDADVQSLIVWMVIGGLVLSVINWYCTSMVYSYYEELVSGEQSDQGRAPREDMVFNSMS